MFLKNLLLCSIFIFGLLLSSFSFASATISGCQINSSRFEVVASGMTYRQSIDDFHSTVYDCNTKYAAIYDGDDIYSYSQGQFSRSSQVEDNAQAVASQRGITVEDYLFYLDTSGSIQRKQANQPLDGVTCSARGTDFIVTVNRNNYRQSIDSFSETLAFCNQKYAAAYDGDDLYVFDVKRRSFSRSGAVDDGYRYSALLVTDNGVLFYDGDDLYSYFSGTFNRYSHVDDRAPTKVTSFGIIIGDGYFNLSSNGEIQRLNR